MKLFYTIRRCSMLFALLASFAFMFAQAPDLLSYQAVIRNASNNLVASQNVGVRITILQNSPAGTEIYKEVFAPNPTTNSNGLLSLNIGSGTPITGTMGLINWASGPYFIKTEIDPAGGTNYTLVSISQMMSVPYALNAKTAQSVAGISGTAMSVPKFIGVSSIGNSQLKDDGTSVGLNVATLNSNIKFQVNAGAIGNTIRGTLVAAPTTSISTSGSIYGESSTGIGIIGVSGNQNGVYGLSTGNLGGTVGVNTGTGNAIWGVATGAGTAGFFEGGVSGRGIVVSTGASGFGTTAPTARLEVRQPTNPVAGLDDNAAIVAYSHSTAAAMKGAVNGTYNTSNYGTAIHGVGYNGINFADVNTNFTTGNQDIGVFGSANTAGVEGVSVGGIGVVGYNRNSSFAAVTGGGNTYGVYGYANTIGGASAPSTRYGVYGFASGAATNYAGYFSGNVLVTGTIAKGGGTFKIDHPLDPENKYLYHSFIESPDMMNIYNGNVTTDSNGVASVKLPEYFEALNKDFRYQLTVVGTFAQAIVGEEIKGNVFVVKTDKPNVKVSWQVTGVRKDKFAEAHRVKPVVDKEPEMRGKYLHAAEWGKSDEMSQDFVTRPKDASTIQKGAIEAKATQIENKQVTNPKEVAGVILE